MNNCNGRPAHEHALAYVEGALAQAESEQFEEHYFHCDLCHAEVQRVLATAQALADHPVAVPAAKRRLAWLFTAPVAGWAGAAAVLVALAAVFALQTSRPVAKSPEVARIEEHPAPAQTGNQPAAVNPALQQKIRPAVVSPSQLADLALPLYLAHALRGESTNPEFAQGMVAYSRHDCGPALESLANVPAAAEEKIAAEFYSGACQLKLKNTQAARASFAAVLKVGDTPQQEAAFYEMAQVALADGKVAEARDYLKKTLDLQGDFEARARRQTSLIAHAEASAGNTKALDTRP